MSTALVPQPPRAPLLTRLAIAAKAAVGVFSRDSAEQAYGMLSRIFPGQRGDPPKRGSQEFAAAYSQMPWLRALVERVSFACASVPWQLAARKDRRGKYIRDEEWACASYEQRTKIMQKLEDMGELTIITDHPFLTMLRRGNPLLSGLRVRALMYQFLDLLGESYWIKGRNVAGVPDMAWPIPPHWVRATPTPQNPVFEVGFGSWQVNIPEADVFWTTHPNPEHPYGRGSGLAQAIADELDTDEFAAKYASAFFYNRARPDLVITTEGMSEDDAKKLEARWLAKFRGVHNSFRPFFVNRKVEVHEFGQNFEQMELLGIRQWQRDVCMQVFGVPPEVLGVLTNSNRATIEAAGHLMALYVVLPRLEGTREDMQSRLLPEYDDRLVLTYESPVKEDRTHQLQAMTAAPWAATVDEWRHQQGLPEKEDGSGEVHMVPLALLPTRDIDQPASFGGEAPNDEPGS